MNEPKFENFGDALWYCFAVVTTIGFGDYAASTIIGRILTVILGLYGLVVVAIITSVVVNFYNEIKGKEMFEDGDNKDMLIDDDEVHEKVNETKEETKE